MQSDFVVAYFNQGFAYAGLGRYEEAITDLETALELSQAAATIEETLEAVRPP